MSAQRTVPPVALIVVWPKSVADGSGAEQLVRRLAGRSLCSTWAVEEPSQVQLLRSASLKASIEVAAMVADGLSPVESIERAVDRFHAAGESIAAVHASAELPRGSVERRLCQAGVRAVVGPAIRGESSTVRALPFGLWRFGPHMIAPAARRWFGLFNRPPRTISELIGSAPALACIDLARAGSMGARGWRAIDQFIERAAEASARGSARVVCIADIAAELSKSACVRPQRSILRAAA